MSAQRKLPMIGYDHFWYTHGVERPIYWDYEQYSNLLVVGATGSGKSTAVLQIAASSDAKLVIADAKNSLLPSLVGCPGYYGFKDVYDGFDTVYREFCLRLSSNDPLRNRDTVLFIFDEYAAAVGFLQKKDADEFKRRLGNLIMMGRSLNLHTLVSMQRSDSSFFGTGIRDQFTGVLALGNVSKEQRHMLFPDVCEHLTATNGRGEGYLLLDGRELMRTKIPWCEDTEVLHESIASRLWVPEPVRDGVGEA